MHRIVFALPALLLLAQASADGQQSRTRPRDARSRIDTTFAFDRRGTVSLSATHGDIIVTGSSRDEIHVRATSDDDNLRLTTSASRVSLDVFGSHRGDTRFEVTVPYGARVSVRTQSGDIAVRGSRGPVEIQSSSGDIEVDDVVGRLDVNALSGEIKARTINGDVSINATNGEITVIDATGAVEAKTVSGDVTLRNIVSRSVRAGTMSGEVGFDGAIDPGGHYDLSSHSGDVTLRIPRDANAQLTVSTWSGSVDSEFPITLRPGEHGIGTASAKHFTFAIGAGSARITLESFSGDVTIRSRPR